MKSDLRHRDDSEAHSDRLVSSEYWMEQFKAQCTERLLEKARSFATKRARDLGWEMPGPGIYDPDELVDNIVKETLAGVITWNPQKQDFDRFLYDAVRVRVMRHAKRAMRRPHESIDALDAEGESPAMAEIETQLLAENATPETVERVEQVVSSLHELARSKPLVQRLLDAFKRNAFTKDEVMLAANLSSAEYHNARRQLGRLVDQLPDHLRPRADVLARGA
jgi:hypothetical protein